MAETNTQMSNKSIIVVMIVCLILLALSIISIIKISFYGQNQAVANPATICTDAIIPSTTNSLSFSPGQQYSQSFTWNYQMPYDQFPNLVMEKVCPTSTNDVLLLQAGKQIAKTDTPYFKIASQYNVLDCQNNPIYYIKQNLFFISLTNTNQYAVYKYAQPSSRINAIQQLFQRQRHFKKSVHSILAEDQTSQAGLMTQIGTIQAQSLLNTDVSFLGMDNKQTLGISQGFLSYQWNINILNQASPLNDIRLYSSVMAKIQMHSQNGGCNSVFWACVDASVFLFIFIVVIIVILCKKTE